MDPEHSQLIRPVAKFYIISQGFKVLILQLSVVQIWELVNIFAAVLTNSNICCQWEANDTSLLISHVSTCLFGYKPYVVGIWLLYLCTEAV